MSESAPERGGGADSFFTRKYGPLPGWGWAAIAAVGAGAYILYRRRKAADTAAAAATDSGIPYDYAPQIATLQQEIQDLQSGAGQSPTIPPPLSSSGGGVSGFTPQPFTPTQQPSSNPQASFTGAPVAAAVFAAPSASAGTGTITAARPATTRQIIPTTPPQTVRTPLPMGISVNNARILGIIGPRQTQPAPTIVAGSRPPQNLPLGLSVNNARRLGL